MSIRLRVLSSVYEDLTRIFLYYEDESSGLGHRFLENIDAVFRNISDFPLMYPLKFDDVHRALLTKFPYAVFYSYLQEEVTILAVRNTKQDPNKLSNIS